MTDLSTILIIDDSFENLHLMSSLLRTQYRILTATSGEIGLLVASKQPSPDLILLDEKMPDMDGYAVMLKLRENAATRNIPILLLTEVNSKIDGEHAVRMGATDCISNPIKPTELAEKVRVLIETKHAPALTENQNVLLEAELARRLADSHLAQQATIRALAHLAELSDPETSNHILRTSGYVRHLANCLRQHPRFVAYLNDQTIDILAQASPLHDIGKIGISDDILLKPGKLTPEEWVVMKNHAVLGSQAIAKAAHGIHPPLRLLTLAEEIAHWHHEKWDGSGYPDGLVGDAIPISARLMALADVVDALINARVYKPAMSNAEAREIIIAGRGKHFDPDMTDAFIKHFDDFVAIAKKYQDAT